MAGAAIDCELRAQTGKRHVEFRLARQSDDAGIRRLLRESPMGGDISLSLEREPDYFTESRWIHSEKQTVIATEGQRVVCVGDCTIRSRYVNGKACSVGYLGSLRLDANAAGRFDILRRGYNFFREMQADAPADFYFTSIASDNLRAQKFLERGLPGMPAYEFVSEYVSLLLPVPGSGVQPATRDLISIPDFCPIINEHNSRYQFACCWSAEEMSRLEKLGLSEADFLTAKTAGGVIGGAVWDQRSFKQTVIHAYSRRLSRLRPLLNWIARVFGRPGLPDIGTPLAHAFASCLVADSNDSKSLIGVIDSLLVLARAKHCTFLTLGFAASDSRLACLRRHYRGREYRSRIYVVRWPGAGRPASDLDGRPIWPEVALL
ncbi:MAG TPA: hypothetical protein VFW05_18810 [Verrucomicrobiae bacterium]|nr:hypothetical protein [Verrucomicrobiae bacterium]